MTIALVAVSIVLVAYAFVVSTVVGRTPRRDQVLGWWIGLWIVCAVAFMAELVIW